MISCCIKSLVKFSFSIFSNDISRLRSLLVFIYYIIFKHKMQYKITAMTLIVRANLYNTLAAAKYNKIQKKGF